ncbi:MAG: SMP-30/gluconolactonase/LRE family protein [Planctomycetaceae bacterium]|jgi:sugar lactone lactonase YvrE|nr:SMP-30/gluconolactonase/LRE family protein [Planctomycetaceae bacterium]
MLTQYPLSLKLGECPVWIPDRQRLFFLDIADKKLYGFDPISGTNAILSLETFPLETLTGCIVPCENGNFLIAAQNGIQEVRPEVRSSGNRLEILRTLAHPEADNIGNRYNDGKCSPEGRFWFGSLNRNHEKNRASLYCLDANYTDTNCQDTTQCRKILTGATNSNGLGWSPDGNTFYWIDTPARRIEAFDYDKTGGNLSNRRTVIRFADDLSWGRPDGMTVDAAGNLWVAHWAGGRITHWNPQTGESIQTVPLPLQNVTSLTFGGTDEDTLFITSAHSDNDSNEETESGNRSGNLFAFKPAIGGIPAAKFSS